MFRESNRSEERYDERPVEMEPKPRESSYSQHKSYLVFTRSSGKPRTVPTMPAASPPNASSPRLMVKGAGPSDELLQQPWSEGMMEMNVMAGTRYLVGLECLLASLVLVT